MVSLWNGMVGFLADLEQFGPCWGVVGSKPYGKPGEHLVDVLVSMAYWKQAQLHSTKHPPLYQKRQVCQRVAILVLCGSIIQLNE